MSDWPQVTIAIEEGYSHCFGCGNDNHIGLQLKFEPQGLSVRTVCTLDTRYQGWPGYVHGGIVGCLLDEAMSWAAKNAGINCVTAKYDVRLKRLIPVNTPLTVVGTVTRKTRKVVQCTSTVSLPDGAVVAEGNATHFVIETEQKADDK